MNKLITFEGIDGSGKSTQIKLLSKNFHKNKIKNIILREPGGTNVSEKIRDILLDDNNDINNYTETLLFLSSRSQLINEIIKPTIVKNYFIFCDRFTDSTLAYQGYGRNVNKDNIKILNNFAADNIKPDLTFIFDLDIDICIERCLQNTNDRIEQEGKEFLLQVKKGYLEIAKTNKRYKVIDCNKKTIEEIQKELIFIINFYYKLEIL